MSNYGVAKAAEGVGVGAGMPSICGVAKVERGERVVWWSPGASGAGERVWLAWLRLEFGTEDA